MPDRLWWRYAKRMLRRWWIFGFVLIATIASVLQVFWPQAATMMESIPVFVWWLVAGVVVVSAGYNVWRDDHEAHGAEMRQLKGQRTIPWRTAKLICELFEEWGEADKLRGNHAATSAADRKRAQLLELAQRLRIEAAEAPMPQGEQYGAAAREIVKSTDHKPATMYKYEALCECGVIDRLCAMYQEDQRNERQSGATPPAAP